MRYWLINSRRLIGVHIVGSYVGIIYDAAVMIERKMELKDIKEVVFLIQHIGDNPGRFSR